MSDNDRTVFLMNRLIYLPSYLNMFGMGTIIFSCFAIYYTTVDKIVINDNLILVSIIMLICEKLFNMVKWIYSITLMYVYMIVPEYRSLHKLIILSVLILNAPFNIILLIYSIRNKSQFYSMLYMITAFNSIRYIIILLALLSHYMIKCFKMLQNKIRLYNIKCETLDIEETCSICLETNKEKWLTLNCYHKFHEKCLREMNTVICPICRQDFTTSVNFHLLNV
jgi:hypothetical protein